MLGANAPPGGSASQFGFKPIAATAYGRSRRRPSNPGSRGTSRPASARPRPSEGRHGCDSAFSGIVADAPQQTILTQTRKLAPDADAQHPAGPHRLCEIETYTLPIAEAAVLSAPRRKASPACMATEATGTAENEKTSAEWGSAEAFRSGRIMGDNPAAIETLGVRRPRRIDPDQAARGDSSRRAAKAA